MRYRYWITAEQVKNLAIKPKISKKVFKYALAMLNGAEFPPVKIFFDKTKNMMSFNDGRTRVGAAQLINKGLWVKSSVHIGQNNKKCPTCNTVFESNKVKHTYCTIECERHGK